jgi:hypothetical protein
MFPELRFGSARQILLTKAPNSVVRAHYVLRLHFAVSHCHDQKSSHSRSVPPTFTEEPTSGPVSLADGHLIASDPKTVCRSTEKTKICDLRHMSPANLSVPRPMVRARLASAATLMSGSASAGR